MSPDTCSRNEGNTGIQILTVLKLIVDTLRSLGSERIPASPEPRALPLSHANYVVWLGTGVIQLFAKDSQRYQS